MRNARRLLAALLAVVMLIPSILVPGYAAETTGFKDVREDSWYANAVDYVSAAGYMKGTSKDAFSPGEDVTRAMFVTILSRVARAQTDNTVSAFGDVAANQYYSGAIEWAAEKEIVNGVGGGLFAPYRSITRQDLAVMLYRFVNAMGYELSAGESRTYTDEAAISAYAADAVRFVTSTGLFAGYQDGSFRPKATATRAQTAVIVMRLAQLLDGQIVDPEPMPAQSFDQTSEQMQVSVNAPEGALPENTRMTVSRVTDEAALAELASKVGAEVLGAADISFAKDGAELEPARKVSVRISLDALQSAKNPAVVHVKDDGSFEYVSSSVVTTRGKADAIEFEADSFSVYAVTDNQTNATLTISFYARENGSTGAWKIVNKQILRADQFGTGKSAIADPGVPNITTSQAFEGWMLEGENVVFNPSFTYNADTTKYSVKQINDYCNENPPSGADKEVVLYAAVYDVVYITYHDQAGAVIYAEYKKLANGTASADIVLPYSPFKDNQNFAGWVTKDYVDRNGSVDGSMPTYKAGAEEAAWEVGTVQPITASLDLYPYLEEGFWLIFDNNIDGNNDAFGYNDTVSATYTPSVFVAQGKPVNRKEPANPTRPGYSFVGWYTDKAMTNAYDWGSEQNPVYLTAETTLYAKWDMDDTAEYKVVVWLQRVTDNMNATDANKTYDYYFSTTLTGSTGANVLSLSDVTYFQSSHINLNDSGATNSLYINTKPDETGEWMSTYGFHYLRTKANFDTIKSNGSTVVEVYWDRDVVTYRFYSSSYREYTDLMAQGLYDAPYTGWNTNYMWNLTMNGDVPSSSNTSDDYISISTKFVFYPSGNDTPSVLRQDKTVYFYASSLGDSPAKLSHYTQELNAQGTPYYPTTAEKTAYMNYYNRHSFREFPGHVSDCYRIKLPSSSGTYIYANSSGQLDDGSFTAPFSYRLVTAYTGSGTSLSDYTWSGDWITPSSGWTEWIPHGTSLVILDANNYVVFSPAYIGTMYGYHAPGMAIDFRYKLVEANVTYMYGAFVDKDGNTIQTQYSGTIHTSDNYYYGQSIADAANYTPSVPGYVFVGWYSSPECTADSAYSFTTMPEGGVTVYAKFQRMRFRVICDPTDGGTVTDVSFPGAQATMFRLDYGDKIDGEALSSAMSPGKILLGWYTDKECTDPFSFTTPITDEIEGMDLTYRTASNKSGTDPWNNNLPYTDGDAVVGKLVLYAKWRADPEGVVGIKVRYLGDHAETDKGYFDSDSAKKDHEMTLTEVYTDQALAAAHSATVPSLPNADTPDVGRRFLYWEILDKYGNPTGEIVYPGAPFTIDINKAVEIKTPLPDPNCTHKDENNASTISPVDAVAPSCTETGVAAHFKCTKCGRLFTDANGANETTLDALTVSATGHDWNTNRPTYTWSVSTFNEYTVPTCTAELICGNDPTHTLTETATGQLVVTGTTGHYLAEFDDAHFVDQTSPSFTVNRISVTFKANGETIDELTELVTSGQTVTLPGSEYLPAFTGYTFVGWVQAAVSDTTTAPAYKAPGKTSDPINAPTTFIALYTREQATGGNTTVYKRVTEAPEDWTGNYVLTYLNTTSLYALAPVTGGSSYEVNNTAAAYASTGMRLENDKLYDVAQTYVFKFASRSGGYSMRSASNNTYVGRYVTTTAESAKLQSYSSYDSTYCRWTFDLQSGGNVQILNVYSTSYDTNYPYIGFSSSTDNSLHYCFWVDGLGTSSTSNAALNMYLWKETTEAATQTHYTTTISTYTVTYSVPNGVEQPDPETVVQGDSITLPTAPEGTPSGYTFLGWTTAQTGNATTQPATLTGEYTPSGNVTLYALYSYVQGTGAVQYNLVTTAPADWSGSYVITNNSTTTKYVLKGVTGSARGTNAESANNCATLAASGITQNGSVLNGVTDDYVIELTANGSYYTVKSASTGSYYGQNSSSYLFAYSALNGNNTNWTPAINASGAQLKCAANGSYPYFGFSTDKNYFWAASTNNANVLQLWKQTPVGTTYYTTQIGSGSGGNAVTQPNLASGKTDSNAHLTNLSANGNPNPVTATTDKYEIVTSLEDGGIYVMGYRNSSNYVAAITANEYSNTYGELLANSVQVTQGTDGYYTFASDMVACQWTAAASTSSSGYYTLYNASAERYMGSYYYNSTLYTQASTQTIYNWQYSSNHLYNYRSGFDNANGTYYMYWSNQSGHGTSGSYTFVNSSSADTIILYKLVPQSTTYNVTVASGITNGTVRSSHTTAAAGTTVKLTLTPSEGYQVASVTVTDSNGATVPVTGTSGIFTFTMPASNVTVSATFTNVIPDNVWVVSFRDENGKPISGMNDIYVQKNTPDNLPESKLPDPAKEEHYFLGWYQGDTKCTFPMTVNSDIVLTPKYSPMYAYDYTITLRAVYGPFNPDATTHIYWYANNGTDAHNGAGERYASEYTVTEDGMTTTTTKLPINAQVDIPLPTGNAASQTVFIGDNGGALTWEDHVFLGWARVDNGGTADYAEARILTPNDIYLKWTGTEYEVRNDDGTYSPFSSQKVYADETTPYHDMYAVWAGFYYIYHSSDGSLEAVQVPFDARETKNLVAEAESKNCLYGGYYTDTGAIAPVTYQVNNDGPTYTGAEAVKKFANVEILQANNFWNYTDSCVASNAVTETSLKNYGAVEYDGRSIKHTVEGTPVPFWQKAQAYTELGTELVPTAGTVYYLKEVPKTFLPNRLVYVQADKNTTLYDDPNTEVEEGDITSLYLLTAVDDLNYAENGFFVGRAYSGQDVTQPDNGYISSADTVTRVFTIILKNKPALHYNANEVNPSIGVPDGVSNANLVGFVAAKHLDYEWIQNHTGYTANKSTFYLKPYWITLDGVTVTQNIKGVNITTDGKGISLVNVPNS